MRLELSGTMLKLTIGEAFGRPLATVIADATEDWRDDTGAVCAYGGTVNGRSWMHLPGLASFSFGPGSDEVVAVPCPPVRPRLIEDAYRRAVLPLALQARDTEVLHASGVLTPRGVVGLCAISGTGKSTLAVALSRRGYPLWGDDAVAFSAADRPVTALAIPFDVHLRPEAAAFFGRDPASPSTAVPHRAPLACLCVLERAERLGSPLVVEPLRPSVAFPAVLKHAYCFSLREAERRRRMTRQYLELTANVPVVRLRFEPGLEHLDALLDQIERLIEETSP